MVRSGVPPPFTRRIAAKLPGSAEGWNEKRTQRIEEDGRIKKEERINIRGSRRGRIQNIFRPHGIGFRSLQGKPRNLRERIDLKVVFLRFRRVRFDSFYSFKIYGGVFYVMKPKFRTTVECAGKGDEGSSGKNERVHLDSSSSIFLSLYLISAAAKFKYFSHNSCMFDIIII